MSEAQVNAAFDDLTAGAVWQREKKGKIIQVTVLGVTNLHLKDEQAEKNPPQVVFIDSKTRMCTMNVDQFLKGRVFYNVNPIVENNLEYLLIDRGIADEEADSEEDEVQELEGDTGDELPDLDLGEDAESEELTDGSVNEELDEDPVPVQFFSSSNSSKPAIDGSVLAAAVISYTQRPSPATNEIVHEFLVDAAQLNAEQLTQCFSTAAANGGPIYGAFILGDAMYQWERFLGVYPMYSGADLLLTVVLGSETSFNITEVPAAPAVQVQPAPVAVEAPVQQAQQAPAEPEAEIQVAQSPSAAAVAAQIVQ
ncbi:hypothetical protein [Achromobacter phage Motura]|uniref:Uncharacterized protein n=1 Tax=Achromobacter phage Motura TaxID=2591403 RepID=A0A514CSH8_9CAUD|nr:hypothetical protein H1O15_gp015 [Achromobacter phage Motura]QDH83423.1 hypothetical protein [Achromobacter phage Motura]